MEAYLKLSFKTLISTFVCSVGFLLPSTFYLVSLFFFFFCFVFSLSSIWPAQVPFPTTITLLLHKTFFLARFCFLSSPSFWFTSSLCFRLRRHNLRLALRGRVVEAVEAASFLLRWVPGQAIQLGSRIGPNSFIWKWNKFLL